MRYFEENDALKKLKLNAAARGDGLNGCIVILDEKTIEQVGIVQTRNQSVAWLIGVYIWEIGVVCESVMTGQWVKHDVGCWLEKPIWMSCGSKAGHKLNLG
ncbi:hypothetical protein Droror1_Dr00003493 [Drosera rotundifolia]